MGSLVWTVSYFGIMPGLRILRPADDHPLRRNWLMIVAHLVWGSTMATTLRELSSHSGRFSASSIRQIGSLAILAHTTAGWATANFEQP